LLAARLRVMSAPDVELRWWAGCPSTDRAHVELREALDSLGLEDVEIRMTELTSEERARESGFPGSPTILVDGRDVVTPSPDEPIGLTCRLYRRRDGMVSPTPDPAEVRAALEQAMAAEQASR
jgi:hypothetical protein